MCSTGLMTSGACKGQPDVIETLNNKEKTSFCGNKELTNLTTLCERHSTKYLKMLVVIKENH